MICKHRSSSICYRNENLAYFSPEKGFKIKFYLKSQMKSQILFINLSQSQKYFSIPLTEKMVLPKRSKRMSSELNWKRKP